MICKLFKFLGYATAGPKGEPGSNGRDGKKIKTNLIE
jgi:hypothetical protein